jgi:hypothetical protein
MAGTFGLTLPRARRHRRARTPHVSDPLSCDQRQIRGNAANVRRDSRRVQARVPGARSPSLDAEGTAAFGALGAGDELVFAIGKHSGRVALRPGPARRAY